MDENGNWLGKEELVAFGYDGNPLPELPSSFYAPIELKMKATTEVFLDNDWESVFQLVNLDLAAYYNKIIIIINIKHVSR